MAGQSRFHRPNAEAVEEAIRRNQGKTAAILLHLAWKAGLSRTEIRDLTWDRTDLEHGALRLPDREVPLPGETVKALREWKERIGGDSSDYVAVSARSGARVTKEYISTVAQDVLNAVGLTEIRLKDLRHDYTLRQIETHGLPYALRTSGLSLTTYKNSLSKLYREAGIDVNGFGAKQKAERQDRADEEFQLWQIMQREQGGPAGVALWLVQQMGLQLAQITRLTWDDVDFESGELRICGVSQKLTRGAARVLRKERDSRSPGDDPHIILSARSGKPMTPARLSVMLREIMIRNGMDDISALDLRLGLLRKNDWDILRAWVDSHGSIVPADAARLLNLSYNTARQRLITLTREGYLVHIGHKYYAAEKATRPDELKETILHLAAEAGAISSGEAAERLGITPRSAGYLLRSMAAAGELSVPAKGRYALPDSGVSDDILLFDDM